MLKISVVIPCYNTKEKDIRRAVESVDKQGIKDIELIIIDDGSEERYHNVLKQIINDYSYVSLIKTPNSGVSAARNKGIEMAKGEYVTFLDSDDCLSEHFLAEAYEFAHNTDADFVIGGAKLIKRNSSSQGCNEEYGELNYIKYDQSNMKELTDFLIKDGNKGFSSDGGYIGLGPWARLIKNSFLKSNKFDTALVIGEDLIWNLDVVSKAEKAYVVHRIWYYYYDNPDSLTHKYNPKMYEHCCNRLKAVKSRFDIDGEYYLFFCQEVYKAIYWIWNCYLCYKEADSGKKKKIRKELKQDHPWILLKERRYKNTATGKWKLYYYLYKNNLLFLFFKARRIIGK